MDEVGRLRADLASALSSGGSGLAAADRLCRACVDLLHVDGASISLMHQGRSRGTFGSSGALSRRLDEYQFTFGEGPCVDAVSSGRPVLVADLDDVGEQRWPQFTGAVLAAGVRAVYALPVLLASATVGALDLFCRTPGDLSQADLDGALWAAELSRVPLLQLMAEAGSPQDAAGDGSDQLASLDRVEIHQATGMIIAALDAGPAEALVRLRAHAMSEGLTAGECGWAIVTRRMPLSTAGIDVRSDIDVGRDR